LTSPERDPTVNGGTGRTLVPTHSNLSDSSYLSRICRIGGTHAGLQAELPARSQTAKALPVPEAAIVFFLLVTASLGVTERLREETERVQTEEEAWNARRDAAAKRAEEAQARLDSLGAERNH